MTQSVALSAPSVARVFKTAPVLCGEGSLSRYAVWLFALRAAGFGGRTLVVWCGSFVALRRSGVRLARSLCSCTTRPAGVF